VERLFKFVEGEIVFDRVGNQSLKSRFDRRFDLDECGRFIFRQMVELESTIE
jgi:hypothetical protein